MSRQDPRRYTVNMWIRDYPEFQFDGIALYCKSCKRAISWKLKSHFVKHVSSESHKNSMSDINTEAGGQRKFNLDLVEVMTGCNLPWKKLDTPIFRQFLQKCVSGQYSDVTVPSESTLRKNYLPLSPICGNIKPNISSELTGKYIWVSVNETTNASGLKVANIVVGGLEEECSSRGQLLMSKVLKTTNSKTVADVVHSSLRALWDEKYEENGDKLLLFITNAIPYMETAGKILKKTYQNMLHVTCLRHGLNIVAGVIRECYPNIDKLISDVKEVFHDAPDRIRLFHQILPNTPLPPEPILTRQGTWLQAASYYYSNFDGIKSVLDQLSLHVEPSILQAQQAFMCPTVRQNLEYIHGNFSRIPLAIRELGYKPEKTKFTIVDAMNVVFDIRRYIFELSGDVAEIVKQKLEIILKNNPGFFTMSCVVDLLNGKEVDFSAEGLNVATLHRFTYLKYAPLTCLDMEENYYLKTHIEEENMSE